MTDDQIREKYAWREGERQQVMCEMAERQRRIDADRILAEARQAAASRARDNTVTKDYSRDYLPPRRSSAPAPATLTAEWQRYIADTVNQAARGTLKAAMAAVGQVLGKDLVALERRCAALEAELAEFKSEMKTRAALAEVVDRLDRLEARSSSMKVVSARAAADRDTLIG